MFERVNHLSASTIANVTYSGDMAPRHTRQAAEARDLSGRLFAVVERAKRDFDAVAEGEGVTALQARAIMSLAEPVPMRELASQMVCDPSNITGLADRLERLGAIERVPGEDRRIKLLSLTPRGRKLRDRLVDRAAVESTVMARLDRDERVQLTALLDRLLAD